MGHCCLKKTSLTNFRKNIDWARNFPGYLHILHYSHSAKCENNQRKFWLSIGYILSGCLGDIVAISEDTVCPAFFVPISASSKDNLFQYTAHLGPVILSNQQVACHTSRLKLSFVFHLWDILVDEYHVCNLLKETVFMSNSVTSNKDETDVLRCCKCLNSCCSWSDTHSSSRCVLQPLSPSPSPLFPLTLDVMRPQWGNSQSLKLVKLLQCFFFKWQLPGEPGLKYVHHYVIW